MACRNIRKAPLKHEFFRDVVASPGIKPELRPVNVTLYEFSVWVLPLVIAITFHEAAHGYVAHRLGDNTAYDLGRVSFNPIRHIDPFGTLIMPAILLMSHSPFLFGYAKPVPVNFRALNNPRIGMVLVALRGSRHQHRTGAGSCSAPSMPWTFCPTMPRNGSRTT